MVQPVYTNQELFDVARESYSNLLRFCQSLDAEGYWREPESYLHAGIYEILDMYLESVLLNLCVYCGENGLVQRRFIMQLVSNNMVGLQEEGDLSEDTLVAANKALRMPPIILQLCGLRDSKEGSFYSSYFMDSLFNILIACSLLEQRQSSYADKFFSEIYGKLASFINEDQKKYVVNGRYVFLKVSSEKFYKEKAPVDDLKIRRKEEADKKEKLRLERIRLAELEEEKALAEKKLKEQLEQAKLEKMEASNIEEEEDPFIFENVVVAPTQTEEKGNETVEMEEASEQLAEEKEYEETEAKEPDVREIVEEAMPEVEQVKEEKVVEKETRAEQKEEVEEKKEQKRSVFDYTDEELMALQQSGKLKIKTPRMDRMKKEKEEALKRLQEERVEQIRKEIDKINHAKKLQQLLDELNALIGLAEVKKEIQSLINLIKVKKMRESYNMPSMDVSYHMVFTGNPGTGKTTVARLVAQIYKELGILSEGHLVEVDRAGLVAGYVGQTAMKVKEVVEKAMGGVLFIDEAYALSNKNDANDFGGEAIDTLVKMMEDHRDDLVIIVAGYKEEMDEFLKTNTGLISRFNKFIDFKDYTKEELLAILHRFIEKAGLSLEEDAEKIIEQSLERMGEEQRFVFGNGRGIRNTFESIMGKQADRIVMLDMPTEEELKQIKEEDVVGIID